MVPESQWRNLENEDSMPSLFANFPLCHTELWAEVYDGEIQESRGQLGEWASSGSWIITDGTNEEEIRNPQLRVQTWLGWRGL